MEECGNVKRKAEMEGQEIKNRYEDAGKALLIQIQTEQECEYFFFYKLNTSIISKPGKQQRTITTHFVLFFQCGEQEHWKKRKQQ